MAKVTKDTMIGELLQIGDENVAYTGRNKYEN